jgi:hypothetical protein
MDNVIVRCLTRLFIPIILLLTALSAGGQESEAEWRDGWKALNELGDGFVVWETNRTGFWRIRIRNLDGTGERQLVPDEPGRNHFGPIISPDGEHIAFVSCPHGIDPNNPKGHPVPLYLVRPDGTGLRKIVDNVRMGARSVVWENQETLIYLTEGRDTRAMNIVTGETTPLAARGRSEGGWLLNPTRTHATTWPTQFALYDKATRSVTEQEALGGCEAYFSQDGVWGFWMGGAGGPINRYHLATKKVSPILEKDDPRMPPGRAYLYFPNLSSDGRLFTFAASPNQHDHDKSDYDVFVAQTNPATLEIIGKPVRYSFDGATDRYPDVFVAELPLGRRRGEVPFTVNLAAPSDATWDFGDGTTARGKTAKHTYTKPGDYAVTATFGETHLRGRVQADVAQPPHVLYTVAHENEVVVTFDEPVRATKLRISLASKSRIAGWNLSEDGYRLRVRLAKPLKSADTLVLSGGITDRAQKANALPTLRLAVKPVEWPPARNGLVFFWQTANADNGLSDLAGSFRHVNLRPKRFARFDHNGAMMLSGGAILADDANDSLLNACKASNSLTVEAWFVAENTTQEGPARIVTFSTDPGSRNFTLGQQKNALIFRLRTTRTDTNGTKPEVTLCSVRAGEPTHLIVTYESGRLRCFSNGEPVLNTDVVQGDFANWSQQHLLFGDEWSGERDWSGTLEGVALYNRALSDVEAREHFLAYRGIVESRKPVPTVQANLELVARSNVPSLAEIQPYREAMVVYEYQVKEAVGTSLPKRIRVAHWAILDGAPLRVKDWKVGQTERLTLEPFAANPQLASVYLSDTLEPEPDVPLYYDSRPAR